MEKNQYIKPTVKTVAFTIEHGYAGSGTFSIESTNNDYDTEEVTSSGTTLSGTGEGGSFTRW